MPEKSTAGAAQCEEGGSDEDQTNAENSRVGVLRQITSRLDNPDAGYVEIGLPASLWIVVFPDTGGTDDGTADPVPAGRIELLGEGRRDPDGNADIASGQLATVEHRVKGVAVIVELGPHEPTTPEPVVTNQLTDDGDVTGVLGGVLQQVCHIDGVKVFGDGCGHAREDKDKEQNQEAFHLPLHVE